MLRSILSFVVTTCALAQLVSSVDPEQSLFGITRCAEVYGDALKPADRKKAIAKWMALDLSNKNPSDNTACFTKCLLERLELFDPETKKFLPDNINKQYAQYKEFIGLDEGMKEELRLMIVSANRKTYTDCASVYQAFDRISGNSNMFDIWKKFYHTETATAARIYKKHTNIRKPGQSYFSFCEKKYFGKPADAPTLCKIRKYEIVDSPKFKDHIECIYKGLRYAYGDRNAINHTEINRDFQLLNLAKFKYDVNRCSDQRGPLESYKCFLKDPKSDFAKAFQKVFNYREIRSSDYKLRLSKPAYNAKAIEKKVDQIDSKTCKKGKK